MASYGINTPPLAALEAGSSQSGVSWGAIFAGAAGAASLSLVLLLLGTGLGMSAVSPWSQQGASAATIGVATILWLSFTQIAASGMGGYLAGRLRTKWAGVHTDEVYFRDTAHGFLAWSVATLLTVALLGSVVGAIASAGAQAGATVAGGAATAAGMAGAGAGAGAAASTSASDGGANPMNYFIDSLFRRDASAATPATAAAPAAGDAAATAQPPMQERGTAAANAEVSRIFLNSIRTGALPPEDAKYVGQVVAQRTGLSQQDAEKRVNDTYAKAADAARKASAYASLWLVVSMLIGAFVASFAATWGGRRRDL
jgi:hypothetical protein